MVIKRSKRGFTLVEALIAIAIFAMIGGLAGTSYIFNIRIYKYMKVEKELISDAQFIVDRISKNFAGATIDYDEYYNRIVKKGEYGKNHGLYADKFYNDLDVNTGQNPALSSSFDETDWRRNAATCDAGAGIGCTVGDPWSLSELYFISGDGKVKTMFKLNDSKFLEYKKLRRVGDTDVFESEGGDDFIQISPLRTKISDMKFFVSPIEDPRKAFAERDLSVQKQPQLTIYLKVEPSSLAGLGDMPMPEIEMQTTLSSKVYNEVR